MAESPLLEVDVRHSRGKFELEAHFELRSDWTVLFGPSGAGKTTLLRILAGLVAPNRGRVALRQRMVLDTDKQLTVAPGQRRIGFVTQQAALFPHLTARTNIAFGLHEWERGARVARIAEMLRLFEAASLADRRPSELSGGEQQRIALARALAPSPKLLLLDEPFAALDVAAKRAIVENLRASGVPVLYVSHDLADAWQMNADAVVLEDGRIEARGPARDVLAPYRERVLEQLGIGAASELGLGA